MKGGQHKEMCFCSQILLGCRPLMCKCMQPETFSDFTESMLVYRTLLQSSKPQNIDTYLEEIPTPGKRPSVKQNKT